MTNTGTLKDHSIQLTYQYAAKRHPKSVFCTVIRFYVIPSFGMTAWALARHNSYYDKNVACFQLEKIKKGEGLVKDEDETLIANTYDPDDIKSKKSNKRRQQEQINNSLGKNP